MVPVWGNGRSALDHYQNGEYWQAAAYSALAVSDVFMVKAAIVAVSKDALGAVAKGGSHLVYEGLDAAGKVKYVGITSRNAAVRFGEHLNSVNTGRELLRYRVIGGATGLSKKSARIWEQTLINQYRLGKDGGQVLNQINSISPAKWWQYGIK